MVIDSAVCVWCVQEELAMVIDSAACVSVCVRVCLRGEENNKRKTRKNAKRDVVRLSRTGCQQTPIHRCDPATARHGDFCLLCFHPGPFRLALGDLDPRGSPQ